MKKCSVAECGRKNFAKGFCSAHYRRHCRGADMCRPIRSPMTLEGRFFSRVKRGETPNDCWLWLGGSIPDGYGVLNAPETGTTLAHRISWILHKGALQKTDMVLHRCDVPACVNPDHLFIGTHTDNMRDMANKRRNQGVGKLSVGAVRAIRASRASGLKLKELAATHGVSEATISRAARSIVWREG